jgi:hypothetical protein
MLVVAFKAKETLRADRQLNTNAIMGPTLEDGCLVRIALKDLTLLANAVPSWIFLIQSAAITLR